MLEIFKSLSYFVYWSKRSFTVIATEAMIDELIAFRINALT